VAGVVIGVAGTIYATNEDVRKNLPKAARDLPDTVRRRYRSAVVAAREASAKRREEILHDLEEHGGGNHAARGVKPDPDATPTDASDEDRSTEEPDQR
jgi:hypothetical protein